MNARSSLLLATLVMLLLAACQPSTPVVNSPLATRPPALPTAGSSPKALKSLVINGFLKPYGVDGEGWPPNVEVTLQVYDQPQGKVIFSGPSKTDGNGHFFQDVGVTTAPGMAVSVTDGHTTRSVVLVPLAITAIDPASNTVSGTATKGAPVVVFAGDNSQNAVMEVTASPAGAWQADFSGRLDITDTTVVQAMVRDANANGTAFKTGVK